jgi:hypothetical protein
VSQLAESAQVHCPTFAVSIASPLIVASVQSTQTDGFFGFFTYLGLQSQASPAVFNTIFPLALQTHLLSELKI